MKASALWRMTALLVFLGAAGVCVPAQDASQQSTGDPVADAARKARAEQKTATKPKKVFTNDDIPSAPPSTPAPASSQAPTAQGAAQQGAESLTGKKDVAAGKKDGSAAEVKAETYWRGRFREIHDKIAQTKQELDVLQRELNKAGVQYYSDPQKALMEQHDRSDINEKTAKIAAKQKELNDLNQKLGDMEDELRKAGGDPGWAR